jgi:hypothetical protein
MAGILHHIFCTEKALSDRRSFSTRTENAWSAEGSFSFKDLPLPNLAEWQGDMLS